GGLAVHADPSARVVPRDALERVVHAQSVHQARLEDGQIVVGVHIVEPGERGVELPQILGVDVDHVGDLAGGDRAEVLGGHVLAGDVDPLDGDPVFSDSKVEIRSSKYTWK